ncbi:hypothetical protein EK21DRAFT_113831 [Setomelanomma holmii]|uniref:Uncharacterized protein n=1 Tax=Setomelanomma holmii TaxID=210430 RepID=A0A9P4H7S3_9PLEO|nr:hypothetical protein EK21DRAFT_113831 [Setomelanomma holmii]
MDHPTISTCALPPRMAWSSLVGRSISAWEGLALSEIDVSRRDSSTDNAKSKLEEYGSLSVFLARGAHTMMFWFFQTRKAFLAQSRLKKWSQDDLNDYILLPAENGFVARSECFFVSHFWRTKDRPDPDGIYLRMHQAELTPQAWLYIWVDWRSMSAIIRNCGFTYFYPPFEPRLWILYEISEYALTCSGAILITPDFETFASHVDEMLDTGVQTTLTKHGYRCSFEGDRQFLISWLELLVLLKRLFDVDSTRRIMDNMTWHRFTGTQFYNGGSVVLKRFQGTLEVDGQTHLFTPFPQRVELETA